MIVFQQPQSIVAEKRETERESITMSAAAAAAEEEEVENNENQSPYEESWELKVAEQIRQVVLANERQNAQTGSNSNSNKRPYMVALAGLPGSGKTISAMILASNLENKGIPVMVMPHDGYHYPLEYLRGFPDAEEVIYRRGAPETFDPAGLLRDLHRIRDGFDEELITVPGFDHAKGDPEPDKHAFDRHRHKVVICEGLYLLHQDDGWEEVASMFDFKIFINADIDLCMERVNIRNQVIPNYTPEEIAIRTEKVDRLNALTVLESQDLADVVVESIAAPLPKWTAGHHHRVSSTNLLAALDLEPLEDYHEPSHMSDPADWTLEITTRRPRSDSLHSAQSDRESTISIKQENKPEPSSIGQIVGSWEEDMAKRIREETVKATRLPFMVALVGTPGSGKSISSFLLAKHLEDNGLECMVTPHDGYHYPLSHLRNFPDADDVIYRRGAPDTFDPEALIRDLHRIRDGDEAFILLPAFDHANGDPEPNQHGFDRHRHKVVICEGLYLLHDKDGWEGVADCFDLKIFMNSNIDVCMERVKIRNQCIPGYTHEEIAIRTERVDRVNALTVLSSKPRADVIVETPASAPPVK